MKKEDFLKLLEKRVIDMTGAELLEISIRAENKSQGETMSYEKKGRFVYFDINEILKNDSAIANNSLFITDWLMKNDRKISTRLKNTLEWIERETELSYIEEITIHTLSSVRYCGFSVANEYQRIRQSELK